jgi:uncharacterized SAM-binding protein YcdF (DUF218 family)
MLYAVATSTSQRFDEPHVALEQTHVPGTGRMSWLTTQIISALLLPPLNLALLLAAGFLLRKRWPRIGATLFVISLFILLLLGTRAGAGLFVAPLEAIAPPLSSAGTVGAQAIVVLGGGSIAHAPEYGGRDIPSLPTLARLRYAAQLHRQTGLPLLVTGGTPKGSGESEAAVMARALREDFATPVKWIESASINTAQNAQLSASILTQAGVWRVLLVTDPIHMARAKSAFEKAGLQPIPAPTGFVTGGPLDVADFVPTGDAMALSHYALHEWIGMVWYWIRYDM